MKRIIIIRNPLEPQQRSEGHSASLAVYLQQQMGEWPATARLYHVPSEHGPVSEAHLSQAHDVTPTDPLSAQALELLDGTFIVVVYPDGFDPLSWIGVALVSIVVSVGIALLMPLPKIPSQRNVAQSSPNNELNSRQNQPRIKGRIPDIFGQVRSTPDLIAVPYSVYENNTEIEHCTMAVGRGYYTIYDAYDDTTSIASIEGSSVQVYRPGVNISTGAAYFTAGSAIGEPPLMTAKSTAVNGQTAKAPNSKTIRALTFTYPDQVRLNAGNDFSGMFSVGDSVTITGATFKVPVPGSSPVVYADFDLSGTYTIRTLSATLIELDDPESLNADWGGLTTLPDETTYVSGALISHPQDYWVGPFTVEMAGMDRLLFNAVALNGLYKDNGERQYPVDVALQAEITLPDTTVIVHNFTLQGSITSRDTVALTEMVILDAVVDSCQVRLRRTSSTDKAFSGQVVDEVKWQAVYAAAPFPTHVFPGVTIVRSRTRATAGALSIKDRKLNLLVTRELPIVQSDGTLGARAATRRAIDALADMALDAQIGRRTTAEVDLAGFAAVHAQIVAHFGTELAAEFCHTFDDASMSFEEAAQAIADAVFCLAYRQNNRLRLRFESPTENSVLLFNHRNKLPKSEVRSHSFGVADDHDGLSLEYTDPADDARVKIILPVDDTPTNPKKVETVGIRNKPQAWLLAHRLWARLQYQRDTVEFGAMHEADLLLINDRVLIADNTRTQTQDGEITAQDGLIVTTSQPVTLASGSVMHLQLPDGSVDAIPVTAGVDAYHLVLQRLPLQPLVFGAMAGPTYMVTGGSEPAQAFLIREKRPGSDSTAQITAINYDSRYYSHDSDYTLELIPE